MIYFFVKTSQQSLFHVAGRYFYFSPLLFCIIFQHEVTWAQVGRGSILVRRGAWVVLQGSRLTTELRAGGCRGAWETCRLGQEADGRCVRHSVASVHHHFLGKSQISRAPNRLQVHRPQWPWTRVQTWILTTSQSRITTRPGALFLQWHKSCWLLPVPRTASQRWARRQEKNLKAWAILPKRLS